MSVSGFCLRVGAGTSLLLLIPYGCMGGLVEDLCVLLVLSSISLGISRISLGHFR